MGRSAIWAVLLGMLSGVAAGQTHGLSLSGRIDAGVQSVDDGQARQQRVDSGTYAVSRLILRGSEDLGGGWSAQFNLEHRFTGDNGAQANATKFWNGEDFAALAHKDWGRLSIGRMNVPLFWVLIGADDSGRARFHNYSAVQQIQRTHLARVDAAAAPIRSAGDLDRVTAGVYSLGISSSFEDNLVTYRSPTWAGWNLMLAVGAPEGYDGGAAKVAGGNLEWRRPGLYLGLAGNRRQARVGGQTQRLDEQAVAALWDLGAGLKLWGNVEQWRLRSTINPVFEGRSAMLGLSYATPWGALWINHAAKRLESCQACDSKGLGLGLHYHLSARTELYLSHGRVHNEANAANGLHVILPAPGRQPRGTAAGLMHQF